MTTTVPFYLTVKPKETSIKFSQNPVTSGNSVVIFWESRGLPQPSYTITLNGTTVSTGKTHTIGNVKLNDAGIYSCTARNTLGSDSDVDFLHVTGKIRCLDKFIFSYPYPVSFLYPGRRSSLIHSNSRVILGIKLN
jgi:hypothetical protein